MLATENDCSGRSNSEVLTALSVLIAERQGLAPKAFKTSEPLGEKPFQDQDLVGSLPVGSLGLLGMNYRKKSLR